MCRPYNSAMMRSYLRWIRDNPQTSSRTSQGDLSLTLSGPRGSVVIPLAYRMHPQSKKDYGFVKQSDHRITGKLYELTQKGVSFLERADKQPLN